MVTRFTQNMMAKFPSWMKMAKDESSIGAQFLDVFGISFDEFKKELDETVENFYIDTAHTDMIDILYKIPLTTVVVDDVEDIDEVRIEEHDGHQTFVFRAPNLRAFYDRQSQLPAYFIDRVSGYLYLRVDFDQVESPETPFQSLVINGAKHYSIDLHHVWNAFDEFGLLLGLTRFPYERNEPFKERILDVFRNRGNSSKEGIRNGLARELNIEKDDIDIVPFHDKERGSDMVNPDGTPTEKMVRYAKQINEQLKFTWDHLNLGDAYWYSLEQENLGIHYLPHVWDVDTSLFTKEEFQSGIGHGDDLKVTPPVEQDGTRSFTAYVSLMGYYEKEEEFFPEMAFQYKIYAEGRVLNQEYEEEPYKYTVEAAETFDQDYRVIAEQEFPYTMRTDFYNANDFIATEARDKIHFANSNDFLHTQTDERIKLTLNLNTADDAESNWFPQMDIIWEDTTGAEHALPFVSSDDWLIDQHTDSGTPLTTVAFADIYHDDDRGLGLGYGAFVHEIDTTVEWQQGEYKTNTVLIRDGKVTLNLDEMSRLMN